MNIHTVNDFISAMLSNTNSSGKSHDIFHPMGDDTVIDEKSMNIN